jgi:hypothetical protein
MAVTIAASVLLMVVIAAARFRCIMRRLRIVRLAARHFLVR